MNKKNYIYSSFYVKKNPNTHGDTSVMDANVMGFTILNIHL